jgi:hypothetical protein
MHFGVWVPISIDYRVNSHFSPETCEAWILVFKFIKITKSKVIKITKSLPSVSFIGNFIDQID